MLHTLTIVGGPQAGKTTAALAYAKAIAATGGEVLFLSPTHSATLFWADHGVGVLGGHIDRVVFATANPTLLEMTSSVYRTIVVNDWDRLSSADRFSVEAYAKRCAEACGMAWLVRVRDVSMTIDGAFQAFTDALQAAGAAATAEAMERLRRGRLSPARA
jgi:hypothetical protein